jgi:RNA-directed DNA polymerase
MGVERRGRLIEGLFSRATGLVPGGDGWAGSKDKPFVIPRLLVWEAYQRVKANKGAAGVDGQSLAEFETNLKNNLYKIWNRMSSGLTFRLR